MADKRNKLSRDVENEVRHAFGDKVFDVVIPRKMLNSLKPHLMVNPKFCMMSLVRVPLRI